MLRVVLVSLFLVLCLSSLTMTAKASGCTNCAGGPMNPFYNKLSAVVVETHIFYPHRGAWQAIEDMYFEISKEKPDHQEVENAFITAMRSRIQTPQAISVVAGKINSPAGAYVALNGADKLYLYFEMNYWPRGRVSPSLNHDVMIAKFCSRRDAYKLLEKCGAPFLVSLPDDKEDRVTAMIDSFGPIFDHLAYLVNCSNGGSCNE